MSAAIVWRGGSRYKVSTLLLGRLAEQVSASDHHSTDTVSPNGLPMLPAIQSANLAARFRLELCLLRAVGY